MKNVNRKTAIWIFVALISIAVNVVLVSQRVKAPVGSHQPTKIKPATDSYTCPMHPTIVQDHPGDCPICGMTLVPMQGSANSGQAAGESAQKKIAFYRSPMDPKQTSPAPRKDEMGMDYVPVYEDEVSGAGSDVANRAEVVIDPTRQQLIGLRTNVADIRPARSTWRAIGRVQTDPRRVFKVNVKTEGFVQQLFADFVGKTVTKGDPLFTYYSPPIYAAEQEYLLALSKRSAGDESLVKSVRQRLLLWDVTEAEIARIESAGEARKELVFYSPATGVITAKNIVQGSSLMAGDMPLEITDLSSVWVLADAYQSDAARVKLGDSAVVTLSSLPGESFSGRVSFLDPTLDPASRTFKLRVEVANSRGKLKPEMFADVVISNPSHQALTVPADAIVPTGTGNMVFVAVGDGRFQPREVVIGDKTDDRVEIMSGLQAGEQVVTRANFLIDSESSLRAALASVGGK